jgi:hypothetical protein
MHFSFALLATNVLVTAAISLHRMRFVSQRIIRRKNLGNEADSMTNYRRAYIPGATWFFTVNLTKRKDNCLLVNPVDD